MLIVAKPLSLAVGRGTETAGQLFEKPLDGHRAAILSFPRNENVVVNVACGAGQGAFGDGGRML